MSISIVDERGLKSGESYEVKKTYREQLPKFKMIGDSIYMNAFKILTELSVSESYTLNKLVESVMWSYKTNKVFFQTKSMTPAEKNKFSKGFKGLNEKNIVRRISREHYMINPDFIIPKKYEDVKEQYNLL